MGTNPEPATTGTKICSVLQALWPEHCDFLGNEIVEVLSSNAAGTTSIVFENSKNAALLDMTEMLNFLSTGAALISLALQLKESQRLSDKEIQKILIEHIRSENLNVFESKIVGIVQLIGVADEMRSETNTQDRGGETTT